MNKETIALTEEQYIKIIKTIRSGFVCKNGHKVKPNDRIATILVLEANIGIRICDVLQLKLSSIIKDGERYRLNIVEKKSKLKRNFTVPLEIYAFMQSYALENNINPAAKLFDISERAVNKHLKLVCDYLGYVGIGSHSFRKYFATSIYVNNHYDINLVRVLLQHSSAVTTQRYIGLQRQEIENALQNHIKLL
ncbi:tyrosine-type recombinase/integrase [Lacrimispora indolis]|uniref:tyrosine-type recombinase/integrase n=1 Tax=Lacrimispora indolis TaxID=69825 RepID=UPI000462780D|nr:tyrosine-type recombinase/integrase [[Clostridium] methoxybenzovorans]